MQRTISAMVGKGSVNHNSRKFKAENVDAGRSYLNIDYCNENIKKVYHELFDEALARYNAKQTRANRKIANYYEKIRSSKQEKPFHELILQIGDKENMSAESENGQLARQVLDEYYRGFQERNPQLRVFSAHLHLDEATPHLHIDFVPFTTGSKRGLDTRVSLKQALAAQGFKGGSRGDTEWSQWVLSEKEQLAIVMERYGIEWEQKGTHEKHLSVLDYKKQERAEEIEQLESKIIDKQTEFETLSKRIQNFDKGTDSLSQMQNALENAPEYQLSEPQGFMTAKSYKSKVVEPLIKRLKSLIKTLMVRCFQAIDDYQRLNQTNASLYRSNEKLKNHNKQLTSDNNRLREEIKDYKLLRRCSVVSRLTVCWSRQGSLNSVVHALEIKKTKGRNRQWQRQFLKKWVALMYGKGIILSPALLGQPKKKISLSAYGGKGTNAIYESIKEQPILPYLQAAS